MGWWDAIPLLTSKAVSLLRDVYRPGSGIDGLTFHTVAVKRRRPTGERERMVKGQPAYYVMLDMARELFNQRG